MYALTDSWSRPLTDYCQLLFNYLIVCPLSLFLVCLFFNASSLSWSTSLFTGAVSGAWSTSYPCIFYSSFFLKNRWILLASMLIFRTLWLTQNPSLKISLAQCPHFVWASTEFYFLIINYLLSLMIRYVLKDGYQLNFSKQWVFVI